MLLSPPSTTGTDCWSLTVGREKSLYTVRRAAGASLHGNMIRVFTASTVSRPNALDAVEGLGGFHHVRLLVRCISDGFLAAHLSSTRVGIRACTRALSGGRICIPYHLTHPCQHATTRPGNSPFGDSSPTTMLHCTPPTTLIRTSNINASTSHHQHHHHHHQAITDTSISSLAIHASILFRFEEIGWGSSVRATMRSLVPAQAPGTLFPKLP